MCRKFVFLIAFLCLTIVAFAQKRDDILGTWVNPSGEGHVEIFKKGDKYFGKLIWIKELKDANGKIKLDLKNPNASLRQNPILGLEILKNFVFDEGKWTDGSIYEPKTGKTYSCTMTIKNAQLNIRGYIGISLIGRSETWKRVK